MPPSLDISIPTVKTFLDHCLDDSCSNSGMSKRLQKYANRRARLLRLIEEKTAGNKAEFARLYGYTRAQIGQYTSETYNEGFSMGEGVLEKLEDRIGLPPGWFDWPADGSMEWPFKLLDEKKVRELPEDMLIRAETAFLVVASQIGLDVKAGN
jgi:hypothetical protein